MPNPDDRRDNVERLRRNIENTQENMKEARETLRAYGHEMGVQDRDKIVDKNERRREAIRGFRKEIKDEIRDR